MGPTSPIPSGKEPSSMGGCAKTDVAGGSQRGREGTSSEPRVKGYPEDVLSDDFRMYKFKVKLCERSIPHDWTNCPYAHIGETAVRRDPRAFNYYATMCPEISAGNICPRGSSCQYSHSVFESWLHPQRYKTKMCRQGSKCSRGLCFFAHSAAELREGCSPSTNGTVASLTDKGLGKFGLPRSSTIVMQASPPARRTYDQVVLPTGNDQWMTVTQQGSGSLSVSEDLASPGRAFLTLPPAHHSNHLGPNRAGEQNVQTGSPFLNHQQASITQLMAGGPGSMYSTSEASTTSLELLLSNSSMELGESTDMVLFRAHHAHRAAMAACFQSDPSADEVDAFLLSVLLQPGAPSQNPWR